MSGMPPLRKWATPLTIGSSILISGTGVLMFLEMDRGVMVVMHQWLSWLFLLGIGGHIAANLRPLKSHLRSRWGIGSVVAFTIALAASFFSWGFVTGPQLERPIEEALVNAPLSTLASLTDTIPDALVLRLRIHGVAAISQQSIRELSETSAMSENRLLGIVFLPK